MEPVRFADILFVLLASLVTFGIIKMVNRKQSGEKKNIPDTIEETDISEPENKRSGTDEDN